MNYLGRTTREFKKSFAPGGRSVQVVGFERITTEDPSIILSHLETDSSKKLFLLDLNHTISGEQMNLLNDHHFGAHHTVFRSSHSQRLAGRLLIYVKNPPTKTLYNLPTNVLGVV